MRPQFPDGDPDRQQAVPQRALQVSGTHPEAGVRRGCGHAARGRGGDGRRGRPQVRAAAEPQHPSHAGLM